jgi:hypothetical protein
MNRGKFTQNAVTSSSHAGHIRAWEVVVAEPHHLIPTLYSTELHTGMYIHENMYVQYYY